MIYNPSPSLMRFRHLLTGLSLCLLLTSCGGKSTEPPVMTILSPAFGDGGAIPKQYTCDGENTPPTLTFGDVPRDAQALALLVDDLDVPEGIFVHWMVWNVPATIGQITAQTSATGAIVGKNSTGKAGYYGPCPPEADGPHRYVFTVYALAKPITATNIITRDRFKAALQGRVLAKGTLMGTYDR